MKLQAYNNLLLSGDRTTLISFLLSEIVTSFFILWNTTAGTPSAAKIPVLIIAGLSLFILPVIFIRNKVELTLLNSVALLSGMLWLCHIFLLHAFLPRFNINYLFISLNGIFFIQPIFLSNHFTAFCLHVIPPTLMLFIFLEKPHLPVFLYTVTLPLIGFLFHHSLRRRSDDFTRRFVCALHQEKQTYSDLSMLDPLTGLYNRRGLKHKFNNGLEKHPGDHFVLLIDIDYFKAYNDNYGHAMGDQTLARVSVAIRNAVRAEDIVARYGGEEFLVLLSDINALNAKKLAERINQHVLDLKIPHRFNNQIANYVTLSSGVAPLADKDIERAIAYADRALYMAKNRGRNHVLSWQDSSDHPYHEDALGKSPEKIR